MNQVPSILLLLVALCLTGTTGCDLARLKQTATAPRQLVQAPETPTSPPPCSLPRPQGYVSDFANVLSQDRRGELESKLRQLKKSGEIDFAVVTVETTGGETPFDYSLNLARCWGVGGGNADKAGVLMLVAVKDRQWHIQISRVLEKVLTNDEVHAMGGLMAADLRQQRYQDGINKCLDAMVEVLAERRGFSPGKA